MLDKDVKIGMKVVPFMKTAGFIRQLSFSAQWTNRPENQNYLYVTDWDDENMSWVLAYREGDIVGDFFNASDFMPYMEI